MSSTIGFGLSTHVSVDALKEKLTELADSYGYLVSFDLTLVESEVIEGVEALAKVFELNLLSFLHSPPKPNVALAYDIDVEMAQVTRETDPRFFRFLKELSEVVKAWVSEYKVFFADEWYSEMRVRKLEGSVDDLIDILRKGGGWGLVVFNLQRNWWENFEDFPLVFTVKL